MFPVHFRTHSAGIWRGFDTQSLAQLPDERISEGVLIVRTISGTITFEAVSSLNHRSPPSWAGTALRSCPVLDDVGPGHPSGSWRPGGPHALSALRARSSGRISGAIACFRNQQRTAGVMLLTPRRAQEGRK